MKKSILLVLPLLCLMIFPSISHSLGFEGIGGKLALVLPDDPMDNTIGLGVIASLGTIVPKINALKAEASAEYWGNSYDFIGAETKVSYITFNGTAKYYFSSSGMSPFVGGGLALILARASVSWKTQPIYGNISGDSSSSDTDIGFHLVGGVDIPLGPGMKFVVEGKLAMDEPDAFHIAGGIVVKLK